MKILTNSKSTSKKRCRPYKLVSLFWIICICFLLPHNSLANLPSVHEVVDRALERDQQLRKSRKDYLYDFVLSIEKLDRANRVLQLEKTKTTLRCDEKMRYATYLDEEGKQTKEENQKKLKDSQKRIAVMNLKKLAPRFELSLAGTEPVKETTCYIVRFKPKKNQPYDSREEKIINQLSGTFWIDQKTFSVVKSSGRLQKPVSAVPLFATVRDLNFVYKTQILSNQQVAPASFTLLYDIQTPLKYVRKRETSIMEKYRLAN